MQDDIESIERATLAAVPPEAADQIGDWLLALDPGTVGRAHSAAPLHHCPPDLGVVPVIEARYAAQGRPTVFRLPCTGSFDAMRDLLRGRQFSTSKPSLVQTGSTNAMSAFSDRTGVDLSAEPGDAWAAVFLGEGFDPVDGACRVGVLSRSRSSVYASVSADGRTVAVGAACFSHGWVGVHGMRTLPGYRGRGMAGGILAAFGRLAMQRGVQRTYLQVEAANNGAQALYRRAGFTTAWAYEYWRAGADRG